MPELRCSGESGKVARKVCVVPTPAEQREAMIEALLAILAQLEEMLRLMRHEHQAHERRDLCD